MKQGWSRPEGTNASHFNCLLTRGLGKNSPLPTLPTRGLWSPRGPGELTLTS